MIKENLAKSGSRIDSERVLGIRLRIIDSILRWLSTVQFLRSWHEIYNEAFIVEEMSSNSNSSQDDNSENDDNDIIETESLSLETASSSWPATRLVQASYKDLGHPGQVEDRFVRHLLQPHHHGGRRNIQHLLQQESSMTSRDYSMSVDAFDLMRADPVLGFLLIRYPATLLPVLERAIVRAQEQYIVEETANAAAVAASALLENSDGLPDLAIAVAPTPPPPPLELGSVKGGVATRVHARLVHLPPTCCKATLGTSLSADDVGKLWQVSGTVVRTGSVQMYESARTYKCCGIQPSSSSQKFGFGGQRGGWRGKRGRGGATSADSNSNNKQQQQQQQAVCCGNEFMVHADLEQSNNALQQPETCPCTLPSGERCPGNRFEVVEGGSVHTDYQEIKIQDAAMSNHAGGGGTGAGHIPRSLLIKLQHDLVDHCQPGDEVVVVGMLLAQWQQPSVAEGMDCQVTMAMTAHSVRVIAEKGSSVWKNGGSGGGGNNNSVGEMEKFRKEFSQYWSKPNSVKYPIAARDFICKAVCPKLYGMQTVKLALLLTLIGGVSSEAYEAPDEGDTQEMRLRSATTRDDPSNNEPDAFQLVPQDEPSKASHAGVVYGEARVVRKSKRAEQVKTRRRDMSHLLLGTLDSLKIAYSQQIGLTAIHSHSRVLTPGCNI